LSLLKDHADLDVNWGDISGWTALHTASFRGHIEVLKVLLAHRDINVNAKNRDGDTPLALTCKCGKVSVVRILLKDPRVDVTLGDKNGSTPLWWASHERRLEVVEWFIASGKNLGDVKNTQGKNWYQGTAVEIARQFRSTEIVSLLERFISNPSQTRHDVLVQLEQFNDLAAEVFALTVFLCDDLLHLKPALTTTTTCEPAVAAALQFFAIASKLPMELQMMLCHRAVGSLKQNILHQDSEAAFRSLALSELRSFHVNQMWVGIFGC